MAFNDTLFQLGMDLTRSSPAQKEETATNVRGAHQEKRNGKSEPLSMKKISIDLYGALDIAAVRSVQKSLSRALSTSKLKVTKVDLSRQSKTGAIVGSISFTGGRAQIEAWPSTGYVTIDIQTVLLPTLILTAFAEAFQAHEIVVKKHRLPNDGARFKKPLTSLRGQGVRKAA